MPFRLNLHESDAKQCAHSDASCVVVVHPSRGARVQDSDRQSGRSGPSDAYTASGRDDDDQMDDFDRDSAGREAEEAEVDPMLFENGSEGGEADGVAGRAGDEEEEEGEDLLRDDFLDDYRPMPHLDEYEREHLADSEGDTRSSGQRAADRRAAEREMARRDAGRRGAAGDDGGNRLPSILRDQDDDDSGLFTRRGQRRRRTDSADAAVGPSVSPLFLSRQSPLSPRDCAPGYDIPLPSPFLQGSFATEGTGGGEEEEGEEEDDINDDSLYNMQGSLREWVSRDEVRRFMARRFRHFLQTFKDSRGRHRGDSDADYAIRIRELVEMNSCSLELDYSHLLTTHPILAVWLADAPKQVLEVLDEVAQAEVFRAFPMYEQVHERIYVRVAGLPVIDQIRDIRQTHLNCLIRVGGVVTRRTGVFPQLQQVKYNCIKCGAILGPFFQTSSSEIRIRTCAECQSKGPFQVNVEQTIYRNYQKMTLQESPGSVPAGRLPRNKEVVHSSSPFLPSTPSARREDASLPLITPCLSRASSFPALQIIKSIAPSIYGHENVKTSLALAMFGGQEKNAGGKHRLRGDINALLLGDPGTAKSQFLKYLEKTAHRAVYTTGKGASAVGLTAAVHKDPVTREWTLEGGALVLADRGTCLIDEFDKMSEQDRVSIHEAMEQQSISISKAGIVTSLAARCSVIAAANPIGGRYDSSKTFGQNVELSEPILSRFDCLLVIKDLVDPVVDEHLARFVVGSHQKSHPQAHGHGSDGQAREEDPDFVTDDDVDTAIRVLLESFIGTQKYGVQRALEKSFSRYMSHRRDLHQLLLHLLRQQLREALRLRDLGWTQPSRRGGGAAGGEGEEVVEMRVDELEAKLPLLRLGAQPSRRRRGAAGEGEEVVEMRVDELEAKSEGLRFESQCVHLGHPSAGGCQGSTGDPRLIIGKGYTHAVLGGYGRTNLLLNKPFYPNAPPVPPEPPHPLLLLHLLLLLLLLLLPLLRIRLISAPPPAPRWGQPEACTWDESAVGADDEVATNKQSSGDGVGGGDGEVGAEEDVLPYRGETAEDDDGAES
ncbi:unnamed protein product [Closterium sp. NIES-54]